MKNRLISDLVLTKVFFLWPWICVMCWSCFVAHISLQFTLIHTKAGVREENSHVIIQCTPHCISPRTSQIWIKIFLNLCSARAGSTPVRVRKNPWKHRKWFLWTSKLCVHVCVVCLCRKYMFGVLWENKFCSGSYLERYSPLDKSPLSHGYILWANVTPRGHKCRFFFF